MRKLIILISSLFTISVSAIPGTYFKLSGSDTMPGIFTGNCFINGPGAPVYKPWATVQINLSAYIGQTLSVVATNADCQQGGHFAHSYWDFKCGLLTNIENNEVGIVSSFPNPFTTVTTFTFQKELKDASLLLYNIFGQKVKTIEGISSNKITLHREGLAEGIYIYEVVENGNRVAGGKLVVN